MFTCNSTKHNHINSILIKKNIMNKTLLSYTRIAILSMLCIWLSNCTQQATKHKHTEHNEEEGAEKTGAMQALERDIAMTKDMALGYVPAARLLAAKEYKDQSMAQRTTLAIPDVNWRTLGPKNKGGRTRTMLIDANDATGNTVFAASVGGGLWKTTNINVTNPNWQPVNDLLGNLAVTSIAQDPSNAQVMYLCTGEGYGNIDAIQGLGVWKSTNGGTTWNQLAATNNSSYYYCQKVLVNAAGVLFVATDAGLQRSSNGGTSFTKVLGTGLGITGVIDDFAYDVEIAANGDMYASLYGSIHRSTNAGVAFGSAITIPVTAGRIELACAPNDANYIYAFTANRVANAVVNGFLQSTNGGTSFTTRSIANISTGQAWYDMAVVVDPNNRDVVYTGTLDVYKTINGASTAWTRLSLWSASVSNSNYVHADQHLFMYRTGSSSEAYFVNDGGIFKSNNANATTPTFVDKSFNYVTTQFYGCAMHPTANNPYFLGGTQDNGSHQFNTIGLNNTVEVTGGDGAYVHIDQNEPQYQFTSYVFNEYFRSADGGATFTGTGAVGGGKFINPTDYDDVANKMYCGNTNNNYKRWDNPQTGNTFATVSVAIGGGFAAAIKVSPNTANRVYIGTDLGGVYRIDNAHTATPTVTNIGTGLPAGYINCVEVETGNDNHLVACYTNYGINSIWESTNGGTTWVSIEGNMPDMPVRWALLNPNNNDQLLVATELGVWSTDNINGAATVWGASNSGLANVRVDMLQVRQSDKLVIACTHGRGMYSSDVFTTITANFDATNRVNYVGMPVNFSSTSYRANAWNWSFGEGGTATQENPNYTYTTPGQYNVTLTINAGAATITKNQYIHILPNKATPYLVANGGNFESNSLDFGNVIISGTAWERGNSAVVGKNGTRSGSAAWVTGLTGNYSDNMESYLLTPNYNFTAPGTYTLSFWAKYDAEVNYDGFRVEYSTNKGVSWAPVSTTTATNWYNFANTGGTGAFPVNEAFITGTAGSYTQFTRDISFLATNNNVAFRIAFKSDGSVNAAGVAIDDWEISSPANAVLPMNLLSFNAYKLGKDVQVQWLTSNEHNMNYYDVQRSLDGSSFTTIATNQARNQSINTYYYIDAISTMIIQPIGGLYYRLRSVDLNGNIAYSKTVKLQLQAADDMITVYPNPFTSTIQLNTTETVTQVALYGMQGNLIQRLKIVNNNTLINLGNTLKAGNYILKMYTVTGVQQCIVTKQ